MEYTGERYVPELMAAKISYEHWHRYIFARKFCTQKNVVDVACGEGFGTSYLAQTAFHITGVDISDEVVQHAKRKYGYKNIDFVTSNAISLPFPDSSINTIISFETLEHLTKEDHFAFLDETVRILSKDGILVISTPNKKVYSDEANYNNPYHLGELYKHEFEDLLRKYYNTVLIFNQEIFAGSKISGNDETIFNVDHMHMGKNGFLPFKSDVPNKDSEYLIAICSDSDISNISASLLLDEDNTLIKEYMLK